jgi:hypothetical protein
MSIQERSFPIHPTVTRLWPVRKAHGFVIGIGLVIALAATYHIWAWWVSPEHRVAQFLTALHRGDTSTMVALADAKEVTRLQLTPKTVEKLLSAAIGEARQVVAKDLRWEPLAAHQRAYNRWASVVLYRNDGAPLVAAGGSPLRVMVEAYNSDGTWKIGLSHFLYVTYVLRFGSGTHRQRYATLCHQHGVRAEVYRPDACEWVSVLPTE